MDISVVIPLLNEEESLPELADWISRVMKENNFSYEVIFIDDGSKDKSWQIIEELAKKNSLIKGIKFRRNYGKAAALSVGFEEAEGEVVITMDADLQDSPDEIPELYRMIKKDGFDLVSGWKKKRHDPFSKTIPTKFYNWSARRMSGIKLHDFNCGLKAYKNEVVKSIEVYGEMHRYIPFLSKWAGFKQIGEKIVHHQKRKYGKTKYGLDRFYKGYLDLLTISFTTRFGKRPMHFFGLWGTLIFIAGFLIAGYLAFTKYFMDSFKMTDRPLFYFGLLAMVLGTQLFVAGFLGEMISRTAPDLNHYQVEKKQEFNGWEPKVILIGSAYPLRGGLATFNERLIHEYRKRGDDASIYTFSLQYPGFLFPGKTQYSSEPAHEDIPISIKVNSINPLNWLKVGNEIRKIKPDLVIVKFWMPFMAPCFGTICRIIKRNKYTKIISIIDNIIPHEKRFGDRILAQYWVNSSDGFIAMSKSVMEDLKTFFTHPLKPTLFCAHPLYDNFGELVSKEVAKQRLNLDPHFHYILFFGFIRDYKGLDLLLQAFADERFLNYPIKLIVAGEFYCDPSPYNDLIDKGGLKDRVIMSNDFIPDSEVGNYFCSADLVVQPYKSATQSGVTQIAYHFDKPMIITDVGGLAEFVPDGKVGYVVEPEPLKIADAIIRFYEEKKEEEFSRNASVEKEKYSWGKMIETIDELVNSIIHHPSSSIQQLESSIYDNPQ